MSVSTTLRLWMMAFSAMLLLPSQAELAPSAYRDMQSRAPEVIQIQITARKSSRLGFLNFSGDRNERLEASVLSVTRSKSGLIAGDKITITYLHKKLRGVGPRPIPKLTNGGTYPAWLTRDAEGTYSPAARGASFSIVN